MRSPRLSICVPTYRRPGPLRRCLESVAAQTHPLRYEVRVRDNAGGDDAEGVFRGVAGGRPDWHFAANPRNVGGRDNQRLVSLDAAGDYLLILGDDDWLLPGAFAELDRLLATADRHAAAAVLVTPFLGRRYAASGGRLFDPPFAWLRRAGINVPGFITAVVWRRDYWAGFRFEALPRERVGMPYLLAFLEACGRGPVVGSSAAVYGIGQADDTASPSYAWYTQGPLSNCLELPGYVRWVLDNPRLDPATRRYVWARYLKYFRYVLAYLLFIRYNADYYRPTVEPFRAVHGRFFYWPAFAAWLRVVFHTRFGGWLARRVWGSHPRVAADFRELY